MHRKLWARLLSCVLALSVVLAAVPNPAQAVYYVVGDGGSYALMEYFRHRWPDAGYKIWTDYPQEFRAIISNGGNAFTNYSQRWVGMDYLIGKYGVQEPEDMGTNSAEVLAQLNAARQAFDDAWAQYQETNKPYQPGGIGGGSGDTGGGDEPSFSGVYDPYTDVPSTGYVTGVNSHSGDGDLPFSLNDAYVTTAKNLINDHFPNNAHVWVSWEGTTSSPGNLNLWVCPASVTVESSNGGLVFRNNTSSEIGFFNVLQTTIAISDGVIVSRSSGGSVYVRGIGPNGTYNISNLNYLSYGVGDSGTGGGGTGGTVNPVPDPSTIEKPESPVTPSNPQTPERDSPMIVIGGTTQTVPDPSPAPDLSTIEELLRRILANTNTIIEQMNSFASQLGQELADFYDVVYDWFGVIDSRLRDEIALLDSQVSWLETLYDWAQSIDSDIQYLQSVCQNGFNDVTAWLRNIFNRMVQVNGGGSKPGIVDPADPSPVTDWLRQLWTSFLADLQMVLPDQVGAVVDFLDQLRQKFPFSIPWDIAAMLALLNHAPVTPVIDIPWGYAGDVQMIHVDCHAWDDAVEIVRPMFLLLFALCLALLTRDLLAGLEAVL